MAVHAYQTAPRQDLLISEQTSQTVIVRGFRDPGGSLLVEGDRILRAIRPSGLADLEAFLDSPCARKLMETDWVVRTEILKIGELGKSFSPDTRKLYNDFGSTALVEHERIEFPSYPYEWPLEMLHAAGRRTLDVALTLLPHGLGLKDANPYNILFRGPQPVLVDVLSVERRNPTDPRWLAYAQFVRTFLLPLLAGKYFGLCPDQWMLSRRDGIEPEEIYRMAGPLRRLLPPFLSFVSMPVWLGSRGKADNPKLYAPIQARSAEQARFVLKSMLERLRRSFDRLAPKPDRSSKWADYMTNNSYAEAEAAVKRAFVQDALREYQPARVLDVGCNSGQFSRMAAQAGASVVAIDSDATVAGTLWRAAHEEGLNILPLVVNIARPSPSAGWNNQESISFLDRARGRFDAVLMLAVIHHLLVSKRIPLPQIMELASQVTSDLLLIEFVAPQDPMFRRIVRGREQLHADLTKELFESAAQSHFTIIRRTQVGATHRWLYALRKK